jgi:GNAT superfamily N-acetyltransferase
MGQALIREARLEDAPAIARVHVDSWRISYRGIVPEGFLAGLSYEHFEDRWRGWLLGVGDPRWAYRVAEQPPSGRIVGFASGGPRQGPAYADYVVELYALYLLREHQHAGIGRGLFGSVARGLAEGGSTTSLLTWVLARKTLRGASTRPWAGSCLETNRQRSVEPGLRK